MTQEIQFALAMTAAMSLGAGWLTYKWLRKTPHAEMHRQFESLLEDGRDGSVVAIAVPHSELSLRFFKWESVEQGTRLELMISLAPWSDEQRRRLEGALKSKGFRFRKRRRGSSRQDEGFMVVEACPDCDTAVQLASLVLEDGFGLTDREPVEILPMLEGLRATTVSFAERSPSARVPGRVSLSEASWT